MRKLKRMIALVTVAMFLLSLAAPAFASTQTDAFDRLNALGVVYGDTNGDPMYDKNYTRAEAAAVMVQLSGMGAAIDAAKGATKFSDVPASHWASGVINLAVGAGIIKGYPNGTYKPEANVSYAEMCAMLVQVLGYGPKLQGTWPSNVIGKAAELGLLDDLSISNYNDAAVRSNVFVAADNALEVEILQETKDGYETQDGETLMTEKLNASELENKYVTEVASAVDGKEADELVLANDLAGAGAKTYTVKTKANLLGFVGQKVKAYVNDDDEVISLKSDEDEVFVDKIKAIDATNHKITFQGKGVKDVVTTGTPAVDAYKTYKNFDLTETTADAGDYVTVIMDGSKVAKLVVTGYTAYGIVESVENERIVMKDDPSSSDIDLKDVDMDYVQIYKNGKVAGLADIKAGDLVASIESNDKWLITASDKVVSGKLTGVIGYANDIFKMVVGDATVFSANDKTLEFSTDNGDSYETANLTKLNDDVVGEDVKVYVDANGEAIYVVAGEAAETASNKVLVRNITSKDDVAGNTNSATDYIKVTKMDGTDVTYEIDNDDYTVLNSSGVDVGGNISTGTLDTDDVNGKDDMDVKPFDLAKLTLDSAGKVTKVEKLTVETMVNGSGAINTDNKLIYNNASPASAFVVTDDTVFIQVDEYGDVGETYIDESKKITWATVDDNESDIEALAAGKVKFYADNKEAVLVFINDDLSLTSDKKYGVAVGGRKGIGGGDYAIKLMVDGESKDYTLADAVYDTAYASTPVIFELDSDGKIDTITGIADSDPLYVVTRITVKSTKTVDDKLVITANGTNVEYIVKKEAVKYFDNTGSVIVTDGGVSNGDVIDMYDFLDKDGDVATSSAAGNDNAVDGIYDYVVTVD